MTDEKKPRPIHVVSPGYHRDRTNDIRIKRDDAQRLIARYLRERAKLNTDDANDLASSICTGLAMKMPTGGRPGLRGFRMIPESPPGDVEERVAAAFRAIRPNQESDWNLAREVWSVVYGFGNAIPDDVVE